jgi:hypothetical protein
MTIVLALSRNLDRGGRVGGLTDDGKATGMKAGGADCFLGGLGFAFMADSWDCTFEFAKRGGMSDEFNSNERRLGVEDVRSGLGRSPPSCVAPSLEIEGPAKGEERRSRLAFMGIRCDDIIRLRRPLG